ncbi:MAG: hypothetical protein SPL42_03930 [Bacteroidales bacterium]|nr:hypothetical protein [Bacteroidales bacterium]
MDQYIAMGKVFFSDFVNAGGSAQQLLHDLQRRYPASSLLNMFALASTEGGQKKRQRARMALTVRDFDRFIKGNLDIEPVVTHRESPGLHVAEHKTDRANDLTPIFVKHPVEGSDDRQVLIDQLIAKFSKDAPKIIYSPDTHDADADYGEDSSKEDFSIASVSLAETYVSQGYPERAVQMYEILKLHFPEKNSIFAARIEELKNSSPKG